MIVRKSRGHFGKSNKKIHDAVMNLITKIHISLNYSDWHAYRRPLNFHRLDIKTEELLKNSCRTFLIISYSRCQDTVCTKY
mmetsp:Transcript_41570/g.97289  ORF Transcript_41570/g.97289 Transcript_41570/m.97289 type:complete len:81 (-) Transcript_41570:840-1082(-)